MPKITNNGEICHLCGALAQYQSINSKQYRCVEKITKCPGHVAKAKVNRTVDRERMKKNNKLAHAKLRELEKDQEWVNRKSSNLSEAIKLRGGHSGNLNPRFNKPVSEETRHKMSAKAIASNHKRGQYERNEAHRDRLSQHMIDINLSGRNRRVRDTKPERFFERIVQKLNIPYTKQFLIQFGQIAKGQRFRHCYDFHITGTNVLVEIDGDYWHSQPKIILRDRECEEVAAIKGYEVVRFKQSDLETNVFDCIIKLYNSIQLR